MVFPKACTKFRLLSWLLFIFQRKIQYVFSYIRFSSSKFMKISISCMLKLTIITLLPGGNSFRQPKNVVRTLSLVNILQMSWNWYMLFISDIARNVLKKVYIRQMVCLQRHTKVFRYITVYGGKILKAYFNMFILQ